MKLFIIYNDAAKKSREDMALMALCQELKKMHPDNFLGTIDVDPLRPDFEIIKKVITAQKETLPNGSV